MNDRGRALVVVGLLLHAGTAPLHAQVARDTAKLTPVNVIASPEVVAAYLARSGYTERKRTGQGVYLDGAKLDERRKGARQLADVLRAIPGVSRIAVQGDHGAIQLRGMESISRPCGIPLIYLDGMVVATSSPRELNTMVNPQHLLAIEVYRGPSELPSEYSGAESGCGVILIWTIHSSR